MAESTLKTSGNPPTKIKMVSKTSSRKELSAQGTNNRSAGKKGEYVSKTSTDTIAQIPGGNPEDGIAEMDGGVMLTTSEIIDFSEGADSHP